jgi:transcriptional regulator
MKLSPIFLPSDRQIDDFVAKHPLGIVFSCATSDTMATPLPLLLFRNADGSSELHGHFARANPHLGIVRTDKRALIVFQGPNSYISPSWMKDRTQAPTWNFTIVEFQVEILLHDDLASARASVEELTSVMELSRPNPWSPKELGSRYEVLLPHIVPFRAPILRTRAKFKLGQNERSDVLKDILRGLDAEEKPRITQLISHANSKRLNDG